MIPSIIISILIPILAYQLNKVIIKRKGNGKIIPTILLILTIILIISTVIFTIIVWNGVLNVKQTEWAFGLAITVGFLYMLAISMPVIFSLIIATLLTYSQIIEENHPGKKLKNKKHTEN